MKKCFMLFAVYIFCFCLSIVHAADNRGVAIKTRETTATTSSEHRTALVIGNSAYPVSPLKNPANDAVLMAKTLRGLGFAVDERTNLSQSQMKQAIEAFGKGIRAGGVGLFYFAGHGMQVNGRNYLIPIDADIQGEAEVDFKAVDAGLVMAKLELARNGMNIVILDACRNNPFSRSFRSANQGLASMNAPSGTLIAYATAPGSVASDGAGANGLYTEQLVKNMKRPGLRIEDVFKQVRTGVKESTQGKQVPWESSSLEGDFYFFGPPGSVDASPLAGLAESSKERQAELERLKKLEAEDAQQRERERAEIAKKEKELAELDAQIASMKSRLGAGAAGADDSLEKTVAMVKQKEADARHIEQLKKQREAETSKRQVEITRLKKEADHKRRAAIEKDIASFETIAKSPYGKDMAQTAWKRLINKYASIRGIDGVSEGDTAELRSVLLEGNVLVAEPETGMKFVEVKGGCFPMGDTFGVGEGDERPVHEVCVDDYFIGKYEVTQAQWRSIMGNNPSNFSTCGDTCPVEQVSWNEIQEFIRILNQRTGKVYRLPTEAEWEYAARSGGRSEKYSGSSDIDSVAWYSNNSESTTHPVGQKKPNGLGLYDMSGNVWEWCSDWYDENYYRSSPKNNPQGPAGGSTRVLRGGAWLHHASDSRASFRFKYLPVYRFNLFGFRLARTR